MTQSDREMEAIFHDGGIPVKFFIQKDIPQVIQMDLQATIMELGGRIETKVPRQGYILVQHGTSEERRLRLCWKTNDRPNRHIVPYTYIDACRAAGKMLKQIFIHEGEPIMMYIHPSIANPNARETLSLNIMHSGGAICPSEEQAQVILADQNTTIFRQLLKTYEVAPEKYIETFLWIKKCTENQALEYTPVVYKNPGGRRAGEERTLFSQLDDDKLCKWIAVKIPFKDTPGRTGNKIYQQLCAKGTDPEYKWVNRHTWQSWRERYKKNSDRLDKTISRIVSDRKITPGMRDQYSFVRKPEEKPKRTRKKKQQMEEESGPSTSRSKVVSIQSQPGVSQGPGITFFATNSPEQSSSKSSSGSSDINDPEWAVKIGHEPPPRWSKRKAAYDFDTSGLLNKRSKTPSFQNTIDPEFNH